MRIREIFLALAVLGLCAAAPLSIPADQPICNLYGIIKVIGTIVGVLMAAYAGFILASTHELTERNAAKALLSGVAIGLIIIWLAPLIVTNLVGTSGSVCGWTS
jgi:formate-dependent nitrite reductase membrane component NrfD